VGEVKLARIGAGLSPGEEVFAVRRKLVDPEFPYPSEMKRDPSLATATWVHRLNGCPLRSGAGFPGTPIVKSTLPSSVHFRMVWSPSSVR
jgi:hypothetical protein